MEEENKEEITAIEKRKNKINNFLLGWVKDNYDKIFLLILIAAFAIRLWIFFKTKDQALWYDATSYLSAAKRWGLGLQVNDLWYYRRGFFWALFSAFFFRIGLGELTIRFTEVLFSTGIVAVSYFLIRDMFNKKAALLTSIGLTLSWVLLFFTGRPLTSIPATFFLLTGLFLFWKGYVLKKGNKFLYISGLFFGIAALTRFQYLLFSAPLLILIFSKEKFKLFKNKTLWITLGIFFLMILPHMVLYSLHYGFFLQDIFTYYLGFGAEAAGIDSAATSNDLLNFGYFLDLPYLLTKPVFVLFLIGVIYFFADLVLGFDKIFKNKNVQKRLFILSWIVIPLFALGRITDYVEERYVIPLLPFLIFISIFTLLKVEDFSKKYLNLKKTLAISLIFLILIAFFIPNFLWGNQLIEAKKTSYMEVKQAGLWLKENSNTEDIVISSSMPYITYYAERPSFAIGKNETAFEEMINEVQPRYLLVSVFEIHETWAYTYPQENQDKLKPVKSYSQGDQPVLIIYEFNNYSNNIDKV